MIARIGKYTIEKELGHGGFGDVFLAYDPDVGQKVAIKHLRVELGTDPDMLRRFQHEIRTTASLRHKNIVAIFASGVESGNPYLVMEFLEGRTLKDIIQAQQPLTLLEKVGIMTQAAEGLAYAHTKGIVHRDVKPENIMLLPDDTVKIMDFGIALAPDRNTVMTETGGIIGTPPYFAPEQLQGYKANEQTDIFSLGDVYYELLTGQHPFERFKHDWKALQMAILSFDPPAVSQLAPGCPEALELLVHRMIAKEREFRYETFQDVLLYSKAILVDLQRDRAASIVREVTPLVERGDLQAALGKLGEAQQLDPGNREARQLRDTITQRLQKTQVQGRVSELLSEAEAFAGERRFAEAVQSLESAARLDSSNVTVQVRLGEAKAKLDSSVRASRLVSEARFQQQKGQLTDALDRLAAALAIDPDHTEALALSPRVRELVERQARDNRRERAIQIASELLSANRYSEALSALEQIEQEQPGLADVAQLRARIHQGKAEHEQRQRAERLNLGVTRTREAMQAGELDRAGQMLDHLLANFANEPGAAGVLPALREQLNAQIRAQQIAVCRQEARDLLQKKSYREALDLLDGALRKFPDDTGLMRLDRSVADLYKAHQRSEAIAAAMNEAGVKRDAGDYQGALDRISVARGNLGDEPALVEVARQLELEIEQQRYAAGLEDLLQASRELMAAGKYSQAIDRIAQAPEYAGEAEVRASLESARVSQAIEEEHRVVSTALAAAERLSSQGDWAAALEPLEKALGRYPHEPGLKQTADRLREQIARERQRAAIENHRSTIRREIQDQAWKKAEAALRQARSEFPGEKAFDDLAGQVETGLYNTRLDEVASGVRQKLAANSLPEAVEEIELSRTVFAHDSRWKSLAEEVAKRKEYEAALLEAEGNRKKGDLPKAEALLTTVIRAGPPDQRATQILRSIQAERSEAARQAEIAAAAGNVRELLQRGDLERASGELEKAREMYPGQSAWATLQADIEARQAVLRRQAEVPVLAESIRRCLALEDVRRSAAELALARAKYPGESLWPTLQAEIDALQKSLQRRAGVAELVENLRACLKRNDARQAAALLNAARSTFPDESVWVTLQSEIEALQVSLTEMEIAAVAGSVRGCLRRNDIPQAAAALSAARAKYQDRAIWATLQSEIDALQASLQRQAGIAAVLEKVRGHLALDEIRPAVAELLAARGKYPDEPVWATLESEINARQTVLKRRAEIADLAQSVRGRMERGDVGEAASELEAARRRYPGESQWATLQAGIDARQAVLRRQAEVAAIAKSVREHLVRDHLREAASELGAAQVKYPDENLWATLRSELDARQAALKEQAAAAAREAKAAKIAEDRLKREASKAPVPVVIPVPVPEPPLEQPIPFWRRPVGIGVLGLVILAAAAGAYKLTHLQQGVPDGAGSGSGVHIATTSGGATGSTGTIGSSGATAATGGESTGTHVAGGATGTAAPTGVVASTGATPTGQGDSARAARIGDLINRRDWAGASREWASVSASLRKTPAFSALANQLKAHDDKAALLEQARADLQGERLQAAETKARSLLTTEFQPESQKVIDDVRGKVDSFADQVKRQIDDKNAAEAKKRLQVARKDYPADSRWDALAARIADLEKPAANPCPPAPQAPAALPYGGNDNRPFTWTGQLPQGCKLVLIGDRASTGSLTGLRFIPALEAEVKVVGGDGVTVTQQPSAANNFMIELTNNSPRPVLTIQMFWTRKR